MSLGDLASFATIGAFLIAVCSLAFSARRYLNIREKELSSERFQKYHCLIKAISKGSDETGELKLVSQIAYIYELRNFKEYASLTETVLTKLFEEWTEKDKLSSKHKPLKIAIDKTLAVIKSKK